jgi:hypothetical protein
MRFSIKWMLAGTVYVALVAAAFATGQWPYAAALWVATFFAVVYALALAALARGRRRAAAIGFALGSVALAVCLQAAPGSVPTARIVSATLSPQAQPLPQYAAGPQPTMWYAAPSVASGTVITAPAVPTYPSPPVAHSPSLRPQLRSLTFATLRKCSPRALALPTPWQR